MKKLLLIGLLFFTACYEYIPPGVEAQFTAERYLDSLQGRDSAKEKVGVGFITVKEYLEPSKQKSFQQDTTYHLSTNEWNSFTKKVIYNEAKVKGEIKGDIAIEMYNIKKVKHVTAFLIDSTRNKVFAVVPMK